MIGGERIFRLVDGDDDFSVFTQVHIWICTGKDESILEARQFRLRARSVVLDLPTQ
jgi:hypothetical protein